MSSIKIIVTSDHSNIHLVEKHFEELFPESKIDIENIDEVIEKTSSKESIDKVETASFGRKCTLKVALDRIDNLGDKRNSVDYVVSIEHGYMRGRGGLDRDFLVMIVLETKTERVWFDNTHKGRLFPFTTLDIMKTVGISAEKRKEFCTEYRKIRKEKGDTLTREIMLKDVITLVMKNMKTGLSAVE